MDPSGLDLRAIPLICSAVRFATPVLTLELDPVTSPAGSVEASPLIALAISTIERSFLIKLIDDISTIVSGAANPLTVVFVTPAANSLTTISSANWPNCSKETGPLIIASATLSRQPPRLTLGSSASSGNSETESTASCISSVALDISQPESNVNLMLVLPSLDCDEVLSTPSIDISTGSKN